MSLGMASRNPFDTDPHGISSIASRSAAAAAAAAASTGRSQSRSPPYTGAAGGAFYHSYHRAAAGAAAGSSGGPGSSGLTGGASAAPGDASSSLPMEPSIWAARHVEWPIPTALSVQHYLKLIKASKMAGQAIGMHPSSLQSFGAGAATQINTGSSSGNTAATSSLSSTMNPHHTGGAGFDSISTSPDGASSAFGYDDSAFANDHHPASHNSQAAASATDSNYYGLTGFIMSRVIGSANRNTSSSSPAADSVFDSVHTDALLTSETTSGSRPLRPPRPGCVAAANGWIVAVLECPMNTTTLSTNTGPSTFDPKSSGTTTTTYLHFLTRWNVRRGAASSTAGPNGLPDNWIVLPPPIAGDGKMMHVFMDPSGSHTLMSAANGEAYYLHSSSKQIQKLAGFGYGLDGAPPSHLTGIPATAVPSSSSSGTSSSSTGKRGNDGGDAAVQTGLTMGTYVTAVAWDKERGTEGSTKKILLGTSGGDIYEYCLVSPNQASSTTTTSSSSSPESQDQMTLTLLHKLCNTEASTTSGSNSSSSSMIHPASSSATAAVDPSEVGAAVTGIYFERLRTGLLVLCATSGRNKRTRFYTFYSPHNSSFRMVMAAASHDHHHHHHGSGGHSSGISNNSNASFSLTELPGSIDFADLKLCNDTFGLLTATGIYYGTIDRTLSSTAAAAAASSSYSSNSGGGKLSSGASMIIDSGILPYDLDFVSSGANAKHQQASSFAGTNTTIAVPISLAITPHHLITLSENNEVCFISRVAQKMIQKERIDLGGHHNHTKGFPSSFDESHLGIFGELLMDIRRPDQVWLRKSRSLVHISSTQEDRDVWKFTLQKCLDMTIRSSPSTATMYQSNKSSMRDASYNRLLPASSAVGAAGVTILTEEEKAQEALFEQAKTLCSTAAQKAVVTAIRAEYHLSQGRAELAAKYFAQCPSSLEPFCDTAIRLALPKLSIDDPSSYGGSWKARAGLEASNLPLIAYLSDKMRTGTMNGDKMTSTMIGAWLTELYLHERGERLTAASLEASSSAPSPSIHQRKTTSSSSPSFSSTTPSLSLAQVERSQRAMLAHFLKSNVNNMDAKTIMKILTSHDVGAAECASYAATSGDIATAVNAALSVGAEDTSGARNAVQILDDAPFELAESLYYKHAAILLVTAPATAGESFLRRYAQGLSPLRLLPSFMHYEQRRSEHPPAKRPFDESRSRLSLDQDGGGGVEERKDGVPGYSFAAPKSDSFVDDATVSIKYLEGVIKQGCRSSAVYSYLVSLLTKLDDEEPLYNFLSNHVPSTTAATDAARKAALSGNARSGPGSELDSPLDLSYTLRTVLKTGRHFRSAIKLYMGFGMRQQAVELAIKVDPSLARELAQGSIDLDERKHLWLMIAKNAASDGSSRGGMGVVSRVVSVLKDCGPDVLSIEDVLPFLPDFAQIDQIKDEICEALTSYSSKIEGYLKEMSESDVACDNLRNEIARLRNHRMTMKAGARCALTNKVVLGAGEPFYVFPSGYVILASALKKEVMPFLNQKQRARVVELEDLLKRNDQFTSANRGEWQAELDGLIGAECPLTGSIMVESIDRDFDDCAEIDDLAGLHHSAVERVDV